MERKKNLKNAKLILVCIFSHIFLVSSWAQIPVEVTVGQSGYYYQHSFAAKFSTEKPFGFFHVSSILIPYDKNRGNEIMSQSYVSYALNNLWTSGIGSIYTPMNRIRPTIFLQYFRKKKETSIMLFSRSDLWVDPSLEFVGSIEYTGKRKRDLNIYARLQLQTIWSLSEHLRSTQFLRAGINLGEVQFGLAANFDQYGSTPEYYSNIGLFIRKEF